MEVNRPAETMLIFRVLGSNEKMSRQFLAWTLLSYFYFSEKNPPIGLTWVHRASIGLYSIGLSLCTI